MKTVSSAHFGWSRSKVKAIRRASSPEAVVFAAKIHGIHFGLDPRDANPTPSRRSRGSPVRIPKALSGAWISVRELTACTRRSPPRFDGGGLQGAGAARAQQ